MAATESAIDELADGGTASLPAGFFWTQSDLLEGTHNERVRTLRAKLRELQTTLQKSSAELNELNRQFQRSDPLTRRKRVHALLEETLNLYQGNLVAKYFPARAQQFEFARMLLDERDKEGQGIAKYICVACLLSR